MPAVERDPAPAMKTRRDGPSSRATRRESASRPARTATSILSSTIEMLVGQHDLDCDLRISGDESATTLARKPGSAEAKGG